jgi:hypothetical protein
MAFAAKPPHASAMRGTRKFLLGGPAAERHGVFRHSPGVPRRGPDMTSLRAGRM